MESKKQLIIIPPMSEALKELHEVLEGVAMDENMEITIIDDLKELSQFIATTGQCLILSANAKKCATFLQENRVMLAKNHCKAILFTPKEIPAKTLIKFTKIGLTESILESSPPKTFLYKVKLLLRSIKTAKPQEDAEKLIKSLESNKTQVEEEKEAKEKLVAEENVIDMEMHPKKKYEGEENSIDYSNPLKGKIRPQEETIETNWKSDRKKNMTEDIQEEGNMTAESELANIDMYLRGKQKGADIVDTGDDDFGKLKNTLSFDEEPEEKKKSKYADVIEEGPMKKQHLDSDEAPKDEKGKKALIELELMEARRKRATQREEQLAEMDLRSKNHALSEEEKGKTKDKMEEDLGGYLKGKISHVPEEELPPEEEPKDMEYDNSELEDDKTPSIDLDLIAGDSDENKKKEDEGEESHPLHEGQVDHIEENMIGNEGTVDKIRTRMESRLNPLDKSLDDDNEEMDLSSDEKNEEDTKEAAALENLDLIAAEENERTREKYEENAGTLLAMTNTRHNAKERERDPKDYDESIAEEADKLRLKVLDQEEAREKKKTATELEIEAAGRSHETSGPAAEKERDHTHDGQVDKIDTFYRSGESAKKNHSWDNLNDKKTSLDLIPAKAKKNDSFQQAEPKSDQDGGTIDYRKMKEEFEMMSSGHSIGEGAERSGPGNNALKHDDDDGSFRVVEIDPKGLDFSINIINSIYQKDIKAKQIFIMLASELLATYHCYPVFYTYKLSDKKFSESYNTFIETAADEMPVDKKEWWIAKSEDYALFGHFQSKSMTTWRCPEIIQNNEVWEDVELPAWAASELKTKQVELIFPYFDGLDRMGLAVVFFPDGLNVHQANGILTVLEMARTLFLDTIQRYKVQPQKPLEETGQLTEQVEEKKGALSFFGSLFGKKTG